MQSIHEPGTYLRGFPNTKHTENVEMICPHCWAKWQREILPLENIRFGMPQLILCILCGKAGEYINAEGNENETRQAALVRTEVRRKRKKGNSAVPGGLFD
jgi:hypothetical protein